MIRLNKKPGSALQRLANPDAAIGILRCFAGAALLFHCVGKMQSYNEIIAAYPSFPPLSANVVFTLSVALEALLASLLLIGIRVRCVAILLAGGTLARSFFIGSNLLTANWAWFGIFLLIALAGSGAFAWDPRGDSSDRKK